ncbi:DUF5518 domain-containing protein [Methanobacterium oryzae]|uniref:DUF5518 domain-containing protein n=1 Tax=Methanobacterium oryzae TaxID=69540 RepID=UPI003D1F47F9
MLNWKSLIIGLIIAVTLYFTFISYKLDYLVILSFIIAPFIGGYIVGNNARVGAIHGAIIGFFGSLIAIILFVVLVSFYSNTSVSLTIIAIIALIMRFIIFGIIGAISGATGAIIKNKAVNA